MGLNLSITDLGDWADSGGRGGLDLSVRDLGDRCLGSSGLNLSVTDLRDGSSRGGLDLSITDLGDWDRGTGSLDLSIANLGDGHGSSHLELSIRDLGDGNSGSSLGLSVRDLSGWGDWGACWLSIWLRLCWGDGGSSGLSVTGLSNAGAGGGIARKHLQSNGLALVRVQKLLVDSVVDVGERTACAGVEDGGWAKCDGSVLAHGETSVVEVTSLSWGGIKLELGVYTVLDNISLTVHTVGENTTFEGDNDG